MDELTTLRTARLTLRPFAVADAERVTQIQSNWHVTRFLRFAAWPPTLELVREWLIYHAEEWRAGTAYRFAVISEAGLIGCADIGGIAKGGGDIGYWFDETAWGRGFATEAASAVVDFAFERLGLERLESGRAADNDASGHVLEKLGFTRTGEGLVWSRPRRAEIRQLWYELPRARWSDQ
jgi:ribosomal-protein-alanine N-acetyltransferase